jgi:hypothetical protein
MTTLKTLLLASAGLLMLGGCGSFEADRLEIDPDRVNINDDSLDLVDEDRFNVNDDSLDLVDDDRFNVDEDSPDI